MASKTYKSRALVLRKTKLGEKDLIVTMLDDSGALAKGVAKGARKPGGSLARLELFSSADLLMAQGRSLDVICEARLDDATSQQLGLEQAACASPIAELLCLVAQPDLPQPRLFDLACAAFSHIGTEGEEPAQALAITAAALWKVMALVGYRPSFSTCVNCGSKRDRADAPEKVAVSLVEGGMVCDSCLHPADAIMEQSHVLDWCEALIGLRFQDVLAAEMPVSVAFSVLHLVRAWVRTHIERDLKSLDFLFTGGLF